MKVDIRTMEGLLRGKCLPANILVNESLPAYLVRQFDALHERAEAAECERDDLKHIQELNVKIKQAMHERFTRAEADIARRDAVSFEMKVHYSGIGKSGPWVRLNDQRAYEKLKLRHSGDADYEFRELYTAAPPAVLPQGDVAKALRDCDWSGVSIGNKAIIQAAIEALGAQPQKPVVLPELFDLKMAGDVKTKQYFKGSNDTIKQIAGLLDAANVHYEVKK